MPLTPPDSPIAMRFAAGLGYRQGILHERTDGVVSEVIHTTGGGILARFIREGARHGDATPFETAIRTYTTIMGASGHYVIGQLGECVQVVPEHLSAWHVGAAGSKPYALPQTRWMTAGLEWWGKRWPELRSPRDLAGGLLWRNDSCNDGAVGIEVVPPLEGAKHPWSPECWRTLTRLVLDIAERHSVPVAREYLLTHSDAHPIARSARGEPWDPSEDQWSYDRLRSAIASGA